MYWYIFRSLTRRKSNIVDTRKGGCNTITIKEMDLTPFLVLLHLKSTNVSCMFLIVNTRKGYKGYSENALLTYPPQGCGIHGSKSPSKTSNACPTVKISHLGLGAWLRKKREYFFVFKKSVYCAYRTVLQITSLW